MEIEVQPPPQEPTPASNYSAFDEIIDAVTPIEHCGAMSGLRSGPGESVHCVDFFAVAWCPTASASIILLVYATILLAQLQLLVVLTAMLNAALAILADLATAASLAALVIGAEPLALAAANAVSAADSELHDAAGGQQHGLALDEPSAAYASPPAEAASIQPAGVLAERVPSPPEQNDPANPAARMAAAAQMDPDMRMDAAIACADRALQGMDRITTAVHNSHGPGCSHCCLRCSRHHRRCEC
eukprot:m.173259 g.173259  ORF g.173259 m.173259 type:complete len:244 (-) comp9951_c0_seq12:2722-3453(-)